MVIRDRQWYQALLDDLYTAIEGQSAAGYQWDDTDGWTRARSGPSEDGAPLQHLECWLNLGDAERQGSMMRHTSVATYGIRYQPDDDGMSQGILHASVAALFELLTGWGYGDSVRTSPTRFQIGASPGGWLTVEVFFTLSYPWRA